MTETLPHFIKKPIRAKDNFYKRFVRKSSNMDHLCVFKNLQNHLNQSIQVAKQNYVNKIPQKLGHLLAVSATGHS